MSRETTLGQECNFVMLLLTTWYCSRRAKIWTMRVGHIAKACGYQAISCKSLVVHVLGYFLVLEMTHPSLSVLGVSKNCSGLYSK